MGYSLWGHKESDMTELSTQRSDYLLRPYLAITCGALKKTDSRIPPPGRVIASFAARDTAGLDTCLFCILS